MAAATVLAPTGVSQDDIYFWNLRIDPRVKDYAFVANPLFPLVVCGSYLWFVYRGGPAFMRNRQPFDLRWPIRIHNLFMVVANAFFLYKFLTNSYLGDYNLFCQGMTYATDEKSMQIVHYGYWYLMLRVLDFLDTIFFVLRKKYDHVTFQHVSHHFCCVFSGHLWVTLGMDGQTLLGLNINSFIHVLMYTYYFLASCGPQFRKYLWWKKYLTKIQIYQHICLVLHGLVPVFYDCGYPKFFIYLGVPQGLLGLALFMKFYIMAYSKKQNELGAKVGSDSLKTQCLAPTVQEDSCRQAASAEDEELLKKES